MSAIVPNGKRALEEARDRVYDFEPDIEGSFPPPDDYFSDFRFEPREGEFAVIRKIQREIQQRVGHLFERANVVLDAFYESVRVVDNGQPRQYSDGRYVENWAALPKTTAEQAIWDLQRVINALEDLCTDYEMRAKFAYVVWDDEYQSAYRSEIEGIKESKATIGDRTANARMSTVEERHYYLFTFWTWRAVSDKVRSLSELQRRIEFKLNRDSRDRGPLPNGGIGFPRR